MNTPQKGKESRDNPRVAKMVAIRVKHLSYPITAEPEETGTCKNISENGVKFSFSRPYKLKERLCLTIDLVGWQRHKTGVALLVDESLVIAPLTVIAEVAWCRILSDKKEVEIGAKFLDIPEDDLKALKIHLDKIQQKTSLKSAGKD